MRVNRRQPPSRIKPRIGAGRSSNAVSNLLTSYAPDTLHRTILAHGGAVVFVLRVDRREFPGGLAKWRQQHESDTETAFAPMAPEPERHPLLPRGRIGEVRAKQPIPPRK